MPMDIPSYMLGVGRQARAAARLVARADTATKDQALTLTAQAIGRDVKRLLDANATDLKAARAKKLDAPKRPSYHKTLRIHPVLFPLRQTPPNPNPNP